MSLPLVWLLLLLANLTGIQPPTDIPLTTTVHIGHLEGALGYSCGGTARVDRYCRSMDAQPGDLLLSDTLWERPRLMQHVAMHEYGHQITDMRSEYEAEAYACLWVPFTVTVGGFTCHE